MKKIITLIFLLSSNLFYAQVNDLAAFIKIGRASDNDAMGSFGGGGGGFQIWKLGPIFTLGVEHKLSNSFSTQGYISYSVYNYDEGKDAGDKANDPQNRIIELMGNIKWNIGIFYSFLGAGISNQSHDDIVFPEDTPYHKKGLSIQAKSKTVFAGSFGLGFDVNVWDKISLLAEGDLFFREYLGSAWLLGVKYSLNEK